MTRIPLWLARNAALGATALADSVLTRPLLWLCRPASGALTLATFSLLALLALAQPAFHETGPGWLTKLDLAVTFLDRNGHEIGRRGIRHDDTVALADLPPHLVNAVLATEDRRFFRHWGLDPWGIARALFVNAQADGVVQGGSTITQQLAKNVFLSGERTITRKINEAFLSLWLEAQLSKPQILKLYLDRAYLGAGTFGIAAAAEFYFGKSVRDITLPEAAVLAGLFKAPSRYAPHVAPDAAWARARDVLDNMVEARLTTRTEADAAGRQKPSIVPRPAHGAHPDYYLDWAFRNLQGLAAAGALGHDAVLVAETGLDPSLQQQAEDTLRSSLARDGARLHVDQGAIVVMDPDGLVRALVGGRDYGESQFNRATEALRQPGSAFKPFVYATALAKTPLKATSIVSDAEICIGRWCPSNYGRAFTGAMPLATALARSVNTVAVALSVEIGRVAGEMTVARAARFGRARIIELAHELGLRTVLHDTPSLPLGASEVTLMDMTAAYGAFASGGFRAAPSPLLGVRNARGDVLWRRNERPRRVLGPLLVSEMNTMLAKVVEQGTARGAALPRFEVGGKTGTTSAYRDAWFVGFTGRLVGGVWIGNDDFSPTVRVTGGTLPVQIWRSVMAPAHQDLAPIGLPRPDGSSAEPAVVGAITGNGFREATRAGDGASRGGFEAPERATAAGIREAEPTSRGFREAPVAASFRALEPLPRGTFWR